MIGMPQVDVFQRFYTGLRGSVYIVTGNLEYIRAYPNLPILVEDCSKIRILYYLQLLGFFHIQKCFLHAVYQLLGSFRIQECLLHLVHQLLRDGAQ